MEEITLRDGDKEIGDGGVLERASGAEVER